MPTLAVGSELPRRAAGFTLLELLVVLAIVAIGTASAVLAFRPQHEQVLQSTAHRVAAQLESTRALSRASGIAIHAFAAENPAALVMEPKLTNLGNIVLPDGMQAQVGASGQNPGAVQTLRLGPEPLIGAQRLRLALASGSIWIISDGLRPFEVRNSLDGE